MSNSKATLLAMIPVAVFIFLVIGLLQCDFVTVDTAAFQKEKEYTKEELHLFADFAFPNERKPYIFRSFEESDSCMAQFYISEQEKMVIKMLYSPAIKSGLRKEEFMKQFKLS